MEDREEKLSKAREKLDKFRKKKQKNIESSVPVVSDDGQGKASSTTSPVMFTSPSPPSVPQPQQQVSQEQQPNTSSEEASVTSAVSLDSFVSTEPPSNGDQSNLASYFGSSVSESETVQQFYIGGGKHSPLVTFQ